MESSLRFELVVPCFNEMLSLHALIEKTVESAKSRNLNSQQFNLVLVDNGSADGTQQLLGNLKEGFFHDWFRIVRLDHNLGYGGGIVAGLKATTAPIIGFTHADLQCDPADAIEAFLECQNLGEKVLVKGQRVNRNLADWLVSRVYELAVGVLWGFWCYDLNAQPKVFHRTLLSRLKPYPQGIPFDAFVLYSAQKDGFLIQVRKVSLRGRMFGESHWAKGILNRLKTFKRVLQELKDFASTVR